VNSALTQGTTGPAAVCLGELLIDMVPEPAGVPLEEVAAFRPAVGGAPANVAVGLARLGNPSRFVGKVGEDGFGRRAIQVLAEAGVQVDQIRTTAQARTPLAFVSLSPTGEREFLFYREPGADSLLTGEELDRASLERAPIFHLGSISLIHEPSRTATLTALRWAHEGGALISYDPNLRAPLWPSLAEAHRRLREPLDRTHILKASIEELAFLVAPAPDGAILARPLEPSDGEAASAQLMEAYPNLVAVVVTFGGRGAAVRTRWGWSFVPPFRVPVRDTTGAGDGLVAGLLHWIWRVARREGRSPREMAAALDRDRWYGAVCFGQGVSAVTITRLGVIPALPTLQELAAFLAAQGEMELL